jgi:hypothetical protein
MVSPSPAKKRPPRKNLVAIDGTLDVFRKVQITVREVGRNAEPFALHIIHKEAVREYVDCNNPECFGGGISLGNVLREMVAGRQEEFIGTSFCTGQEGNPEEPGPHPSCATRFEIEATLHYRP